ncbi:hypothetical protein [Enterovirga rhinocerotis]|uniref:Uncharacterized protein n=1 Tax=Enterovirga rhinocerotis TaxID=1339210 RepID=A0A4R7BP15_9HYPH|nr:hypothetical protein [Enterovirga rhinocerotis]TDR87101.1 hypothetical protein EV668_4180 [Enterovirga rhinocerotis]
MFRPFARAALAGSLSLGLVAGAAAQTPVQPQPKDPNMPAPQHTVPEKLEGKPDDTTGSLSDRLERSDGVVAPPAGGAGRTITPADPGTTPVIPPPGSPGSGRPDVEPK